MKKGKPVSPKLKFKHIIFVGKLRGFTIKIKTWKKYCMIIYYKKNSFINILNSSSITCILINNSNIFLAQCLNWTFILTGCHEYLYISVSIWYNAGFTQIKWSNACEVTLRAVLEMLLLCIYVLIETADAKIIASVTHASVYVVKENACLCHSFIHSHRDSQNMWDSYLNRLLQLNTYRY